MGISFTINLKTGQVKYPEKKASTLSKREQIQKYGISLSSKRMFKNYGKGKLLREACPWLYE